MHGAQHTAGGSLMLPERLSLASGVCVFLALACNNALAQVGPPTVAGSVTGPAHVIDGDTIEIGEERIRLYGIDAPELAQVCTLPGGGQKRCGEDASAALRRMIGDSLVYCSWIERDDYGRALGVCAIDGLKLNLQMIRDGWAFAFVRYAQDFVAEAKSAEASKHGLWAMKVQPPWEYRARRWNTPDPAAPDPNCPIKGNINRKGERIYHVPWSPSYERTRINLRNGERWFCGEREALEAGWRPPRN